jgi:hypothetical protein
MAALTEQLEAASARRDAAKDKHQEAQKEADRLQRALAQEALKKATDALQTKAPNPLPPGGSGGGQAASEADGEQAACISILLDVQSWAQKEATVEQQDVLTRTLRDLKAHVDAARAAEAAKAAKETAAATAAAAAAEAEAAAAAADKAAEEEAAKRKAEEEEREKKRKKQ